eukprot:6817816-Alexandrium_andersonii.AAC.1
MAICPLLRGILSHGLTHRDRQSSGLSRMSPEAPPLSADPGRCTFRAHQVQELSSMSIRATVPS